MAAIQDLNVAQPTCPSFLEQIQGFFKKKVQENSMRLLAKFRGHLKAIPSINWKIQE